MRLYSIKETGAANLHPILQQIKFKDDKFRIPVEYLNTLGIKQRIALKEFLHILNVALYKNALTLATRLRTGHVGSLSLLDQIAFNHLQQLWQKVVALDPPIQSEPREQVIRYDFAAHENGKPTPGKVNPYSVKVVDIDGKTYFEIPRPGSHPARLVPIRDLPPLSKTRTPTIDHGFENFCTIHVAPSENELEQFGIMRDNDGKYSELPQQNGPTRTLTTVNHGRKSIVEIPLSKDQLLCRQMLIHLLNHTTNTGNRPFEQALLSWQAKPQIPADQRSLAIVKLQKYWYGLLYNQNPYTNQPNN